MYVAKQYRELVSEEQNSQFSRAILMVSVNKLWGHDHLALSATTGMPFTVDSPTSKGRGDRDKWQELGSTEVQQRSNGAASVLTVTACSASATPVG